MDPEGLDIVSPEGLEKAKPRKTKGVYSQRELNKLEPQGWTPMRASTDKTMRLEK